MRKNFSYEYLGDRALIISVTQGGINNIHEIYSILSKKLEDLVLDFVKTPESLALYNDPYKVSVKDLSKRVKSLLESETLGKKERIAKTWKIPVCYDGSFALDIKHVSKKTNLSPKEIIDTHLKGIYKVNMIGFLPGFVYLSGLDKKLSIPRKKTPRKEISEGSIAIANRQTGIYNIKSPGGWNVIGKTPTSLFNKNSNPPIRLKEGDIVKFYEINIQEFNNLKNNEK